MNTEEKIGSRLIGGTSDLPVELRKELTRKGSKYSDMESYIDNEFNGIATVDELLVCHYRKTGQIITRRAIVQELYKMQRDGRLFPIPGKRGFFTTNGKLAKAFPKGNDDALAWWK